ncbi:MAG: hypothetical protein U9N84_02445 [Actinomycetota bacterium]|nr:hypothetical protein [Actinomycetota bacterium]
MALIPIIILVIAGFAYVAWQTHRRTVAVWTAFAAEMGLDFVAGKGFSRPVLTGSVAGFPLTIDTYMQRSGNNSTTYTRYRMTYPPLGMHLQLSRQGAFSAITKLFGQQDVEVGDDSFDDAFIIKTDDPARLRALMTPSVRSGLIRLVASHPTAVITDNNAQITRSRFERRPDVLRSTTQRLLATAQLLTDPSAGVSDGMVIDRQSGELKEVVTRVRDLIDANPDDVEARIFEIETLAAAGDDVAAAASAAALEQLSPADPDVVGWREALEAKTSSPGTTTSGPTDTNAAAVAQELFGGEELSFETLKRFNTGYVGRRVSWDGTVKRITDSRAVVTVATVQHDLYGNTEIDVVAEDTSGISPTEGQTVTVTGTLATIDPLMRNIFVTDGVLTAG